MVHLFVKDLQGPNTIIPTELVAKGIFVCYFEENSCLMTFEQNQEEFQKCYLVY
jgi:hypothetical protein